MEAATYLRLEQRGGVAQGAGVALHALAPEPCGLALGQAGHGGHAALLLEALLRVEQHRDGLVVLGVGEVHSLLLLLGEGVLVRALGDQVPAAQRGSATVQIQVQMPTSHYSSNNVPYKYSGWAVYRCFNLEFYSGCIDKL